MERKSINENAYHCHPLNCLTLPVLVCYFTPHLNILSPTRYVLISDFQNCMSWEGRGGGGGKEGERGNDDPSLVVSGNINMWVKFQRWIAQNNLPLTIQFTIIKWFCNPHLPNNITFILFVYHFPRILPTTRIPSMMLSTYISSGRRLFWGVRWGVADGEQVFAISCR